MTADQPDPTLDPTRIDTLAGPDTIALGVTRYLPDTKTRIITFWDIDEATLLEIRRVLGFRAPDNRDAFEAEE